MTTRSSDDWVFTGDVKLQGTATLPASSVGESQIGNNVIGAEKLEHCYTVETTFDGTLATDTRVVKIWHDAGLIKEVKTRLETKPASPDTVTYDVQKYASGSWATVLTAVVSWSNSDTNGAIKDGVLTTLAGVSHIADNAYRIVQTVSGGTTAADAVVSLVFWDAAE